MNIASLLATKGDMVVTAGVQFLRDGMRVRLMDDRTHPAGSRS